VNLLYSLSQSQSMKNLVSFLLLCFLCSSLIAQNPLTRRTNYTYDFGTDSYILASEFVSERNEAGQEIFSSFTRWYTWQDSLIIDYLFDQFTTYHPDGSKASTLNRNFNGDTLRSSNYTEFDAKGNFIKDSAYYRESAETAYINTTRFALVYDSEDRIIESQEEHWSNTQPTWTNSNYSKYEYNSEGCLEKIFFGQSAFDIYTRVVNTYTDDCQPLSTFSERWDFGLRNWVNSSRSIWDYTPHTDSTIVHKTLQNWDMTLESWDTETESEVVLDHLDREIRGSSLDKSGRQNRFANVYDAQGNVAYSISSNRKLPTASWVIGYEYELLEKTDLREQYLRKIGWDTLRNAYRYYVLSTQEVDEKGRLIEDSRQDSTWNQSEYIYNNLTWRYEYEDFCDGLAQKRIIKRGEEGLSPQPVSRTDYSYLYKPDCQEFGDQFEMSIAPNPAQNLMILESEMLLLADVKVEIVDLAGRTIFSDAPGERQTRYNVAVNSLQKGTYFIRLTSSSQSLSKTFVKY